MKQNILIFLRGLPGAGKSTFCEEIKKEFNNILIISKDNYRYIDGVYIYDKKKEAEIEKSFEKSFEDAILKKHPFIILDNLNLSEKEIQEKTAKAIGYKTIALNFENKGIDYHTEKNTKGISEQQIKILVKNYKEYSNFTEHNIKPNIATLKSVISGDFKTKSTDAEVELRINTVYEMVVKGASRKYIVRYASENWNVSSRTVDEYLNRVYEEIKETYSDEYKSSILSKQLAKLDDLYVKNYTIEDFRECRNIIESVSKLLGLTTSKVDVTTNGKEIPGTTSINVTVVPPSEEEDE